MTIATAIPFVQIMPAHWAKPFAIRLADITERLGRKQGIPDHGLDVEQISFKHIDRVVFLRCLTHIVLNERMHLWLPAICQAPIANKRLHILNLTTDPPAGAG